ncbi:MAG TPA: hypothetical protein VGO90_02600, partial [Chthoniobacteraceae bacterium]|nr:hypothetical protein [Chthoniobacteraceae bacterium]
MTRLRAFAMRFREPWRSGVDRSGRHNGPPPPSARPTPAYKDSSTWMEKVVNAVRRCEEDLERS